MCVLNHRLVLANGSCGCKRQVKINQPDNSFHRIKENYFEGAKNTSAQKTAIKAKDLQKKTPSCQYDRKLCPAITTATSYQIATSTQQQGRISLC